SLDELIQKFSVDRISKAGAKFDFEKAKWFNHEWIKRSSGESLLPQVKEVLAHHQVDAEEGYIGRVLDAIKERLTFVEDFWAQASFFFVQPAEYDLNAVKPKWSAEKTAFFENIIPSFENFGNWEAPALEAFFKDAIQASGMKIGELMMPFRIMLVGGKFGPDVFQIVELLGQQEVVARIRKALVEFGA